MHAPPDTGMFGDHHGNPAVRQKEWWMCSIRTQKPGAVFTMVRCVSCDSSGGWDDLIT